MSNLLPYDIQDESQLDDPTELSDLDDSDLDMEEGIGDELAPVEGQERDFYENLAEELDDSKLGNLASRLLEDIERDRESRSDWENTITLGMKYLGLSIEEGRPDPYAWSTPAYDTTLSIGVYKSLSTVYAELYPAAGPAKSKIIGSPTQEVEERGERVKIFTNHYLTDIDEGYYPDALQHAFYTVFCGFCAKKVYQDPITNLPQSRMVKPFDLIFDNDCSNLMDSERITQVLRLTKQDILKRERNGNFLTAFSEVDEVDDDFQESQMETTIEDVEGVKKDDGGDSKKSMYVYYECHTNLDDGDLNFDDEDEENDIPMPYVVTISSATKKIVAIRRNWREEDPTFKKIRYFVPYSFLPSFGLYSIGVVHLIGANSVTLTAILRQLLDAATLKNFPGGVIKSGIKFEKNNIMVGASEFVQIDVEGDIRAAFMNLPYGEPSPTMVQLRKEVIEQTTSLIMATEAQIPEIGANAPTGTTLAILEVVGKLQSLTLRSMHNSQGIELKLLFDIFKRYLPETPYPFAVPGGNSVIMKQDFSDNVGIVPVSDPNVLTSAHRLIRSEVILNNAKGAPELHNMREAYKQFYLSMNIENIDAFLLPEPTPVSLDPITENAYMLMGKPVMAMSFQDSASHIIAHKAILADPMVQSNPMVRASVELHIQQHKAFEALKEMFEGQQKQLQEYQIQIEQQMQNGAFVPPEILQELAQSQQSLQMQMQQSEQAQAEQLLQMPEIQNMIAMKDAQEIQQIQQQQQEQMAEQQANQVSDAQVLMSEISQRTEASHLKDEETKLKAKTAAFEAQIRYEGDIAKIEADKEMAEERNEVNLAIELMKHQPCEQPIMQGEIE